jgi:hypothetical protein
MNEQWLEMLRQMSKGLNANADISKDLLQLNDQRAAEDAMAAEEERQHLLREQQTWDEYYKIMQIQNKLEKDDMLGIFGEKLKRQRREKEDRNKPANRKKGLLA